MQNYGKKGHARASRVHFFATFAKNKKRGKWKPYCQTVLSDFKGKMRP